MRHKWLVVTCIIGSIAAANYYYTHRGLFNAVYLEFRHTPFNEFLNYLEFALYMVPTMEKAAPRDDGIYDFTVALKQTGPADYFDRGKWFFHQGNFNEAISNFEQLIEHRGRSEKAVFWLAMSHLRLGEAQNCLAHLTNTAARGNHSPLSYDQRGYHHSRYCTLPVTAFHTDPRGSTDAAGLFTELLADYAPDNRLYRWLLNFSYMTLNRFPDAVPPEYQINSDFMDYFHGPKKQAMEAKYTGLKFEDQAAALGVDTLNAGRGVAVEDFDHDGYLDIVTGGGFGPVTHYRNRSGTGFSDVTVESGLNDINQTHIITTADYDNDGWADLFFSSPFTHFRLMRNNGDGSFSDVTFESGLLKQPIPEDVLYETWTSAWGDVDLDGDLDLFLAQRSQKIPMFGGIYLRQPQDSVLFINENGHFVDRSKDFGLDGIVHNETYVGAAFGDYDADGYIDLFISSWTRTKNMLLRNIEGSRFENTGQFQSTKPGFTASFLDYDHDGRLDLLQSSMGLAQTVTELTVFEDGATGYTNAIFMNTENGFMERSDLFSGNMPTGAMGASYGDINNDGCQDFYFGTGDPEAWSILPNLMFVSNVSGVECSPIRDNISMLQGFGTIQKGHGIVFFDFDNDGDQDIYSSLGGMWPADVWPNQLFVNQSDLDNSWLKIRLRGRQTNHYGLGALIKVVAVNKSDQEIIRYYHMDGKTGFGSGPFLAHVGLINATSVRHITVQWPASKSVRRYNNIELSRINVLDEAQGEIVLSPPH